MKKILSAIIVVALLVAGGVYFYLRQQQSAAPGFRLAKIERGHQQDLVDVREMLARGLVSRRQLRDDFAAIEPLLYKYPAVDPRSFRQALEAVVAQ